MEQRPDPYEGFRALLNDFEEKLGRDLFEWEKRELLSKLTPLIESRATGRPLQDRKHRRGWHWPNYAKAFSVFLRAINKGLTHDFHLTWPEWQAWARNPQWENLSKHEFTSAAALVYEFWLQTMKAILDARFSGEAEEAITPLFIAWGAGPAACTWSPKLSEWIYVLSQLLTYFLSMQSEDIRCRLKRCHCGRYFIDPTTAKTKVSCSNACRQARHRSRAVPRNA